MSDTEYKFDIVKLYIVVIIDNNINMFIIKYNLNE